MSREGEKEDRQQVVKDVLETFSWSGCGGATKPHNEQWTEDLSAQIVAALDGQPPERDQDLNP